MYHTLQSFSLSSFASPGVDFSRRTIELEGKRIKLQIWYVSWPFLQHSNVMLSFVSFSSTFSPSPSFLPLSFLLSLSFRSFLLCLSPSIQGHSWTRKISDYHKTLLSWCQGKLAVSHDIMTVTLRGVAVEVNLELQNWFSGQTPKMVIHTKMWMICQCEISTNLNDIMICACLELKCG